MWDRLIAYLDSIHARDPAPRSRWEILIYPGVLALGLHRVAHWLFEAELYFLARLVNHISRWLTAIRSWKSCCSMCPCRSCPCGSPCIATCAPACASAVWQISCRRS